MHIVHKISQQMKEPFVSTNCSMVRNVHYINNGNKSPVNISVTFIYDSDQRLLTLCFCDVKKFDVNLDCLEEYGIGELLFYDHEDGSLLCVGDELSNGFNVQCQDVNLVSISSHM